MYFYLSIYLHIFSHIVLVYRVHLFYLNILYLYVNINTTNTQHTLTLTNTPTVYCMLSFHISHLSNQKWKEKMNKLWFIYLLSTISSRPLYGNDISKILVCLSWILYFVLVHLRNEKEKETLNKPSRRKERRRQQRYQTISALRIGNQANKCWIKQRIIENNQTTNNNKKMIWRQ